MVMFTRSMIWGPSGWRTQRQLRGRVQRQKADDVALGVVVGMVEAQRPDGDVHARHDLWSFRLANTDTIVGVNSFRIDLRAGGERPLKRRVRQLSRRGRQ